MKCGTRPSAWQDDGHEEFFLLLWGRRSEDELEEATKQGKDRLSRQSSGRSNPEVVDSIPTEVKKIFSLPRVVP